MNVRPCMCVCVCVFVEGGFVLAQHHLMPHFN